jgi:hypothetical protein
MTKRPDPPAATGSDLGLKKLRLDSFETISF